MRRERQHEATAPRNIITETKAKFELMELDIELDIRLLPQVELGWHNTSALRRDKQFEEERVPNRNLDPTALTST